MWLELGKHLVKLHSPTFWRQRWCRSSPTFLDRLQFPRPSSDILQQTAVNKQATAILSDEPADGIISKEICKSADTLQCKTSASGQTCNISGERDEQFRHVGHHKIHTSGVSETNLFVYSYIYFVCVSLAQATDPHCKLCFGSGQRGCQKGQTENRNR